MRTGAGWRAWLEALLLLIVLTVFAVLLGTGAGLFTFSPATDWPGLITIALVAIIIPALAEELVFRVVLAGRRGR